MMALAAGALALLSVAGVNAKLSNEQHDAKMQANLDLLKVAPEPVSTTFPDGGPRRATFLAPGKVSIPLTYWTLLEGDNWMFLNGEWGAVTCPMLKPFASVNSKESRLTVEQVEFLAFAHKKVAVDIWAHVPRFKQRPARLADCIGYGYDATKGLVTIGGKPVAFIAASQPGLGK